MCNFCFLQNLTWATNTGLPSQEWHQRFRTCMNRSSTPARTWSRPSSKLFATRTDSLFSRVTAKLAESFKTCGSCQSKFQIKKLYYRYIYIYGYIYMHIYNYICYIIYIICILYHICIYHRNIPWQWLQSDQDVRSDRENDRMTLYWCSCWTTGRNFPRKWYASAEEAKQQNLSTPREHFQ